MTNNTISVPVRTKSSIFGINVCRNSGDFGEILCTFNFKSTTEEKLVRAISKLLELKYGIILDENNNIITTDNGFIYGIAVYEIEHIFDGLDAHTVQIKKLDELVDTIAEIDFSEIDIDKVRKNLTTIRDVLERAEEYYGR